jgi:hypothetical protein
MRFNNWITVDTNISLATYRDVDRYDIDSLSATVSRDHPLIYAFSRVSGTLGALVAEERAEILKLGGFQASGEYASLARLVVHGLQNYGPAKEMLRPSDDRKWTMLDACPDFDKRVGKHYELLYTWFRVELRRLTDEAAWYRDTSVRGSNLGTAEEAVATYKRIEQMPARDITRREIWEASSAEVTLYAIRGCVHHHVRARGLIRALRSIPFRCTDPTPVGASLQPIRRLLG